MGQTNDIQNVLSISKVLTLTSHNEGFPMVLLESMACGVPVVSFNIKTGPSEIINNGVDGYLIEDGNLEEFADCLLQLLSNDLLLRDFSNNSITSIQKYNVKNIISKWSTLL